MMHGYQRVHVAVLALIVSASMLASVGTACKTSDDCVPSSCCHAMSCVDTRKASRPNCTDVMCTAGCHLGSLDCGGDCECKNSKCVANVRAGMPPEGQGNWQVPQPQQPQQSAGQVVRVQHVVQRVVAKRSGAKSKP